MTIEERGQEEQERRQKKRMERILLPLLALWLTVQLGKCIYREEKRRLGYAHAVEQYMNRRYRKFGDRFRFYFENEERPNGVSTVKFYSGKFPDGIDYRYYPTEQDYWWDGNDAYHLDNYTCLQYQRKTWEAYVPLLDEAFGKGQYTISGSAILTPDWQDYGPETELEEYLNTAESFSVTLDVKGDFTKSEEAIEILRERMVERNWGSQLYISYIDQDGNEIAYDKVGIDTYSIERVKLDQDYKNAEMKERWEHVSAGIQQTQSRKPFRGETIATEERGQEEQERRQKKRIKRILLPFSTLRLAVQLGECAYQEEKRCLGYAHAVEQYMNRKYREFGDRFHFFLENEERPNGTSTVRFYSEKSPDGANYCHYPTEQDYQWDENGVHYRGSRMCLWYQKKMWEAYKPFLGEAFGKGQYTISGGAIPMPDWQGYGPETELEEYLNTAEGFSTVLDVKSDFAKSEEAIEILRKRMVERNWGLRLYICYLSQDGNEITYDRAGTNTHLIEWAKPDWDYKNAEMKERWEHTGEATE